MVSAHTERLLKGPLWTLRAQTMTRASQGAWWECDGSVVGGKTKPPKRKKGTEVFHNAEVCQIFWYVSHTMVQLLLGFLPFSGKTIDFLHDQVVRLPASRQNLSWGAMTCRCSCSAGVLPMDTGDKNSLRKPLQLCGLAGFSFFFFSHPKLGSQETFGSFFLCWTGFDFSFFCS